MRDKRDTEAVERAAGIVAVHVTGGIPRFLLLQRRSGNWDLCQGRLESGEDERTAALRELGEETSVEEVELDEEFCHTIAYVSHRRTNPQCKRVTFFLGLVRSGEIHLAPGEHLAFHWALPSGALERIGSQQKRIVAATAAIWIASRALTLEKAIAVQQAMDGEKNLHPDMVEGGHRLQAQIRQGSWGVHIDPRAVLRDLISATRSGLGI